MALKAVTTTVCKKCGSREVAWQQSKAGKWYLAETTKGRNGVRYPSAPHFKTCERLQRVQAEAQVEAERPNPLGGNVSRRAIGRSTANLRQWIGDSRNPLLDSGSAGLAFRH